MRRAPGEKGRGSSSTAYPPTEKKKKKTITKAIQVATLALESPSTSTASTSSRSTSSALASEGDSSSLRLDPNDPGTRLSELEPKSMALKVINESEEEENMNDFKSGFKERHCKRHHEAIDMVSPPAKKACPERAHEEPARKVPPVVVPPPDVAGPSSAPIAEKEANGKESSPATGEAPGDADPIEEVLDKKTTPTPVSPPSWDEMMEMLKHMSCFTDSESLFIKISDFFPPIKRIFVNLSGDPLFFVSAQLPFGTPESVVFYIQQLQDWTVLEIVEVVISFILPHFQVMHTPSLGTNLVFVIFSRW